MKNILRFFVILIIFVFSAGIFPSGNILARSADAIIKKKVVRKVPRKKIKKAKKVTYKKAKKVKKTKKATKAQIALKAQKAKKAKSEKAAKQAKAGPAKVVSLNYYLEEGVDDAEADKIVSALREMGIEDASVDVNNNTLAVKFNSSKVTTAEIVKKLKNLGYTATKVSL